MRTLCYLLGVATMLLGAYVWLNTPAPHIEYGKEAITLPYNIATCACFIGGFFWFALGRILDNQEEIKKALNIGNSDGKSKPSPLAGKIL